MTKDELFAKLDKLRIMHNEMAAQHEEPGDYHKYCRALHEGQAMAFEHAAELLTMLVEG